jgi:hypothetical protein
VFEEMMEHIMTTAKDCPMAVRRLVRYARDETGKRFPEQRGTIVGLLVFLRLIAPAIANPEAYSLTAEGSSGSATQINAGGRRNLILASRILQWLVNGAQGDLRVNCADTKRVLAEIAERRLPALAAFCEELANVEDPPSPMTLAPGQRATLQDISEIHSVLCAYQPAIVRQFEKDNNAQLAVKLKRVLDDVSTRVVKRRSSQRAIQAVPLLPASAPVPIQPAGPMPPRSPSMPAGLSTLAAYAVPSPPSP